MDSVYLDNNATTATDPEVVEAMIPFFTESFANASSVHSAGQRARAGVERAREEVARLIGADADEIVFTAGGTESDNAALFGAARRLRPRGDHIVTTRIEHPAVLRMCEQLAEEGFRITWVEVDREGIVQLDQLEDSLDERTILVSVMYANNETGVLQPLEEIARLTRKHGILLHSDAVQAAGKVPLDVGRLGVDLLSLSAHKMHGPKGTGALFIRKGVEIDPLLLGGSHEKKRRAGTENVPGIVGYGKACEVAMRCLPDFPDRVGRLRDKLERGVLRSVPDVRINGSQSARAPHVTNLSFLNVGGEALLVSLDFQGIAVSTGAACASGSIAPSHVLTAMGLEEERVEGAIRFSLSRLNSEEEINYVLQVLPGTVARMRELSPVSET